MKSPTIMGVNVKQAAVGGIIAALAVGGLIWAVRMLPDNAATKPVKTVATLARS